MVAMSPSTFAHSCEEAYFLSSDTAAASMQTHGATWLLHSTGPKRTEKGPPPLRQGTQQTYLSHIHRTDCKGMTVRWGPWQCSAPAGVPQDC